jgi:hypothetical protein
MSGQESVNDLSAKGEYRLDIDDVQKYMKYRIPTAVTCGGLTGAAWGYYIGDAAAIYSISYAFGLGFASTAFFGGVYGLRYARQKDDVYNFAISGSLNSAWLVRIRAIKSSCVAR